MSNITDQKRAKQLLQVYNQGGYSFFYFISSNKQRYLTLVGYIGALSAYFAFNNWWILFWILIVFILGNLASDIIWLRHMQKSWLFFSRVTNWDEVKKIADEN